MRLRQLREGLSVPVELEHRAFILREEPQRRTFTDYYLRHRAAARELTGLPFDVPEVGADYPTSSLPALMAAEWVKRHQPERFDAFDLAVYEAFFRHTRDISNPEVLTELARQAGLPEIDFQQVLPSPDLEDAIWADYREALARGVRSIPTVVIGEHAISGAVPYEEYRTAAQQAVSRS